MRQYGCLLLLSISAWGTECSVPAMTALKVAGVAVQSAAQVPATGAVPGHCRVTAMVVTTGGGVPDGSARLDVRLPANWNAKFLFYGVGGLAGSIPTQYDSEGGLGRGYAVAATDGGHQAVGTDGRWAITAPGQPDQARIADYFYRAAHSATVAAKQMVQKYYGTGDIQRAYFAGCSNGGRMALQAAERYPQDFEGIISGAPFLSIRAMLIQIKIHKAAVDATYLTPEQLDAVDRAVYASCDNADGVKDGLIVNPGRCSFRPESLACKPGNQAGECLNRDQVDFLRRLVEPVTDSRGKLVLPGFSISDLGGRAGAGVWTTGLMPPDRRNPILWSANGPLGWQFANNILKYLVEYDPAFQPLSFDVSPSGVISDTALRRFDERTGAGSADDPSKLLPFLDKGGKLLLYHGWSDPALTPYKTILFYEELGGLKGNRYAELQKSARLFMVPGMQHCGGGPGPNSFDLLSAIDNWVAKDEPPQQIPATKFDNDQRTGSPVRTMPLCKFPESPSYRGPGDVNAAANWTCSTKPSLLETGPNGLAAGLSRNGRIAPNRPGRQ